MTRDLFAHIAPNIRRLRIIKGFSQNEIAFRLGISRSTYSSYENGKSQPNLSILLLLSKIYGCSIDQLVSKDVQEQFDDFINKLMDDSPKRES